MDGFPWDLYRSILVCLCFVTICWWIEVVEVERCRRDRTKITSVQPYLDILKLMMIMPEESNAEIWQWQTNHICPSNFSKLGKYFEHNHEVNGAMLFCLTQSSVFPVIFVTRGNIFDRKAPNILAPASFSRSSERTPKCSRAQHTLLKHATR